MSFLLKIVVVNDKVLPYVEESVKSTSLEVAAAENLHYCHYGQQVLHLQEGIVVIRE